MVNKPLSRPYWSWGYLKKWRPRLTSHEPNQPGPAIPGHTLPSRIISETISPNSFWHRCRLSGDLETWVFFSLGCIVRDVFVCLSCLYPLIFCGIVRLMLVFMTPGSIHSFFLTFYSLMAMFPINVNLTLSALVGLYHRKLQILSTLGRSNHLIWLLRCQSASRIYPFNWLTSKA